MTFPYKLSICGNPIDEEVAKAVNVAIAGLPEGAVELKGFLSGKDKENILKKAEIMILPSYGEGLPIVLLEGVASACAIISTSVGAISELFNEKNGCNYQSRRHWYANGCSVFYFRYVATERDYED